jgi:hypothetical protein
MKQVLLVLSMVLVVGSVQATNAGYFNEDFSALETQFNELTTLENAVMAQPGLTFEKAVEANLVSENFNANCNMSAVSNLDFDIGSFLWGFCCWPVGLFTVVLNDNKTQDQKISYLIGAAAYFVSVNGWYWGIYY